MTVASRIVKLESQITYLERKLDHLINVYRKDQMRYKRTDTANSNHEDEEPAANPIHNPSSLPSSAPPTQNVAANQLLTPCNQREDLKSSTMSMNFLSPDRGRSESHRVKNRSSSQPTSLENLRIIPDNSARSEVARCSLQSDKKSSLLPLRATSIKIPSFLDRNK